MAYFNGRQVLFSPRIYLNQDENAVAASVEEETIVDGEKEDTNDE